MVSSCLKIIACGSNSATDNDDELGQTERKVSPEKHGWSFRKKSTSQRVLSNNTTPDTQSTGNKQYLEPTNFDFHEQSKPAIPEKISVLQWQEEVTPLSTKVSKPTTVHEKISALQLSNEVIPFSTEVSKLDAPEKISVVQLPDEVTPLSIEASKLDFPEKNSLVQSPDQEAPLANEVNSNTPVAMENAINIDPVVPTEESSTIDSSTTLVNFIKVDLNNLEEPVAVVLQSAIRGYLAKRAFLKLRNVVKLQAAVRGLLVRRQAVGSLLCVQAIVKMQALVRARHARSLDGPVIEEQLDEKQSYQTPLIEENSETKAKTNYSYTHKLLYNRFARQLLESTPKKNQIRIKCDPSRPDSSWKWFDRWTTVSSSKYTQQQKPEVISGNEEQEQRIDSTASEVGTEIPAEIVSESADLMSTSEKTTRAIHSEENLINNQADSFDFQVSQLSSKEYETYSELDMNQTVMQLNAASQTMSASISSETEAYFEQMKPSVRIVESEQPETEDKGSKKPRNPAFIAAKSKFEDLSLRTISGRSINQDNGLDMKLDNPSFSENTAARTKEHSLTENSISYDPRVYVWGSECGTELSISSTLDSPDRSEIAVGDFDNENKVEEKIDGNLKRDTDIAPDLRNLDVEAKIDVISQPISPCPVSTDLAGKVNNANREFVVDSVIAEETPSEDQKPERISSDLQTQLDATTNHELHPSSLDGSPGNNVTSSELNKTPKSKETVKPKKNKVDRKGSPKSKKSQSAAKNSPSNATSDSGARSSTEQLPKEPKNGKKRSSLGSARLDHVEVEPRDSISSSNSLPSYMQATQSAKAKAHVNNSPRSRSDVQDKDIYIKKRHSLPANGKQGSPRVDPSTSQRQLGANGNHSNTP